jgi:putative colanic acid biosynthesis acetyltransferase WcaF
MESEVKLAEYSNEEFSRGRSALTELFWLFVSGLFVESFIPGSRLRVLLLKLFGAKIAKGVIIKPGVKIKFPWRLQIGQDCWIGERVWIDCLAQVTIKDNCCISQGAYLCTGSHDWKDKRFALVTQAITIQRCAWIGAFARVAPGVEVAEGVVLAMGSVLSGQTVAWGVYRGCPAEWLKQRELRS